MRVHNSDSMDFHELFFLRGVVILLKVEKPKLLKSLWALFVFQKLEGPNLTFALVLAHNKTMALLVQKLVLYVQLNKNCIFLLIFETCKLFYISSYVTLTQHSVEVLGYH